MLQIFIIFGPKNVGKTFFLKKRIQNKSYNNYISTHDFKLYSFQNSYVIDTPCIYNYIKDMKLFCSISENIVNLTESVNYIYIFFISEYMDHKDLFLILEYLLKNNKYVIIYDYYYLLDYYKDCQIIRNSNNLYDCMKALFNVRTNIKTFKILLIGFTNVGKTSFINKCVNHNLFKVSETKYTTKEVLRALIYNKGINIELYDSFGIENFNKNAITNLDNLMRYVDRVIILIDKYNYKYNAHNFIFNRLNKKLKNFQFMINKIDITSQNEIEQIKKYLSLRYHCKENDVILNSTMNSNSYDNLVKIVNLEKPFIINRNINIYIKKYFPEILFIRELDKENIIYHFQVCFKNNSYSINQKRIIRNLKLRIMYFINTSLFNMKFTVIKNVKSSSRSKK